MAQQTVVKEKVGRFNLVTGENTYSGAYAQDPATSRRLLSLIPSLNGELAREGGETEYIATTLGDKVGALFQYDFNDTSGNRQSKRFAATSTALFLDTSPSWSGQGLPLPNGTVSVTPFQGYPSFEVINNLLHFSDGVNSWIYDGPNNAYVLEGFPIPLSNSVAATNIGSGAITANVGLYYWFTWADETSGRVHESSSSPISAQFGPGSNMRFTVFPFQGTASATSGSAAVVGTGTAFDASFVGMRLIINGVGVGTIASVADATHLTLTSNSSVTTNNNFVIAPVRATHIHIYRSETDGSKLGKFLISMPVGQFPPSIVDNSPFQNQNGSTILDIERPIRNDPPPSSSVLSAHKYRLWRRREVIPNRFTYSANEEVASGANGSPQESVPGTDVHTLSDLINETAYPKPATAIRALKSHGDALYIGTENEIIPLWGDTIGEFALSQVTAIDGGVISRWGLESSSHGLIIFSYDRKLYLYPPVSPLYSATPQDMNVTDQLVELGRPMRNKFLTILSSDIQNVRVLKYKYNVRDWLVVCYQDKTNVYHTYVYDFETKGWFELQRGFVSVAVFETSPGVKILVGGDSTGVVWVVDDVMGSVTPNTTLPSALFRTSLIDFGNPTSLHEPFSLEVEISNSALMDSSTTVNFYLDPIDADTPGDPITLPMFPVQGETNRYRGFFATAGGGMGVVCKRLMVELNVASDTNAGSFRSIVLDSNPVNNLMR